MAVSTSIRNPQLREPDVWAFCDRMNANHGQHRTQVWNNEKVLKVVPHYSRDKGGRNVIRVPYCHGKGTDHKHLANGRKLMDGKLPLMRDTHKSVTFALGWLAFTGVRTIIIAGCDLRCGRKLNEKYGYDLVGSGQRARANRISNSLGVTYQSLKRYAVSAERHGIKLLSWSPGGRIEEFMEKYDDGLDDGAGGEGGEAAEIQPL